MHPAFSVIFFTTASGAGFGLFAWMGLMLATGPMPRITTGILLATGAAFAVAGLFSSVAHLGQPTRAWRAFSQWRSSWLSREGVLALLCYAPALWFGMSLLHGHDNGVARGLLAALSLATVLCTGMIYASLKPIPAWRHGLVLPM